MIEYNVREEYMLPIFFFFKEFQPMASALDNSYLLSDQDTNQFWV